MSATGQNVKFTFVPKPMRDHIAHFFEMIGGRI
jgi:hypothetical protein